MRVLFVASEVFPLVKTGGLADVVGALPPALKQLGLDVRVLVPGYPKVLDGLEVTGKVVRLGGLVGAGTARLLYGRVGELELLVLDAPQLYDRPGNPYTGPDGRDWPDNHRRFAALCDAAAWLAGPEGGESRWRPDLIHGHDWQSGLAPAYVALREGARAATVTTIHNLAYQGVFPKERMPELGLPWWMFDVQGVEYYGHLGFLKAGLWYSDKITTVSPTYARQIQTERYGHGMQGLLQRRDADLHGILNGIDTTLWDPATDAHLAARYDASDPEAGKRVNKLAVQAAMGLERDPDAPLLCVVSRLVTMKGLDLLLSAGSAWIRRGGQLAILGSGEERLEQGFRAAAAHHPGRVAVRHGYNEPLAHLLQGGSDAIAVPSRTEPCGLTQMYALRYGTIPVVRRTGGLADSVVDASPQNLATDRATGVLFDDASADALAWALGHTLDLYRHKALWAAMVRRAMQQDFGWARSAARYAALYRSIARG
jgi:starch synthase